MEWFEDLPVAAQDRCRVKIERLREMGYELRRPEADYLRDGIYELRIKHQRVNYRILYFFHKNMAAVLTSGLQKERQVPAKTIDDAIECKRRFERDPKAHTHAEQ